MRKFIGLLLLMFACSEMNAQLVLLQDNEKLFTAQEAEKIDSLLQSYHLRSGNHVCLITTDTLNMSPQLYIDRYAKQNLKDKVQSPFGFVLLMSRANQLVFLAPSDSLNALTSKEQVEEIINAGIPQLKEKKTAAGATSILLKAMEVMDGDLLKKKQQKRMIIKQTAM